MLPSWSTGPAKIPRWEARGRVVLRFRGYLRRRKLERTSCLLLSLLSVDLVRFQTPERDVAPPESPVPSTLTAPKDQ